VSARDGVDEDSPRYGTCDDCGEVGWEVVACSDCGADICPFCHHDICEERDW